MNKKITIRDVAQAAGVSISTVHQALNDKPGVSDATREHIRMIADNLGYRPNKMASGLKRRTQHISIPDLFAIMNTKQIHHDWNADCYYEDVHTAPGRKASDCLKCGKCEKVCPQHLPIRKLLEQVAAEFEKAPAAN